MGISGLLPLLKEIQRPAHVKDFAGQTVGVDGYVWLHRGVYACAQDVCLGLSTTKYISYALAKVRLLRHHGVEPFLVFDGGPLPSKRVTEVAREQRRAQNLEAAKRLLAQGKKDEAREAFSKAVDVTPEMAYQLIKALRREGIASIVAPYEADAQLRYLEMHNIIQAILTEDSDLLVYGSRNVLFKLDKDGACVHICRDRFPDLRQVNMSDWTDREFRQMAVLSGCDYLRSIPGMGIKRSYQMMRRFGSAEKVIRFVALEGALKVPPNYARDFRRAELTFLHQLVYDPVSHKLVPLHPLPDPPPSPEDLCGCGEPFTDDLAQAVAEGRFSPVTREPMVDIALSVEGESNAGRATVQRSAAFATLMKENRKSTSTSEGQTTLVNFFSKCPQPANRKKEEGERAETVISAIARPQRETLGRVDNITPTPSPPRPVVQSKFFGEAAAKVVDRLPIANISVADPVETHAADSPFPDLDDAVVEDAVPLRSEQWDASDDDWRSDVISITAEAENASVEADTGDDLPSSQMQGPGHDPFEASDDEKGGAISSPSVSPDRKRRRSATLEEVASSPEAPNFPRPALGEDDVFGSTDDLLDTPRPSPRPLRASSVQSPAPLRKTVHDDSDPVIELSSDPVQPDEGCHALHSQVKQGSQVFATPQTSKKSRHDDEEPTSPALERVAAGLRERFMHKRTPQAFAFGKTGVKVASPSVNSGASAPRLKKKNGRTDTEQTPLGRKDALVSRSASTIRRLNPPPLFHAPAIVTEARTEITTGKVANSRLAAFRFRG